MQRLKHSELFSFLKAFHIGTFNQLWRHINANTMLQMQTLIPERQHSTTLGTNRTLAPSYWWITSCVLDTEIRVSVWDTTKKPVISYWIVTQFTWHHRHNNLECANLFQNITKCKSFTPFDTNNCEFGTGVACDVCARSQSDILNTAKLFGLWFNQDI